MGSMSIFILVMNTEVLNFCFIFYFFWFSFLLFLNINLVELTFLFQRLGIRWKSRAWLISLGIYSNHTKLFIDLAFPPTDPNLEWFDFITGDWESLLHRNKLYDPLEKYESHHQLRWPMNKMGEEYSREEETVREIIFRRKRWLLEVITCPRVDMSFGLLR